MFDPTCLQLAHASALPHDPRVDFVRRPTQLLPSCSAQHTCKYGYNVARIRLAISGCIRRCKSKRDDAIGRTSGVDGSIIRSISDSSKRYGAPVAVSNERACSFTCGLYEVSSICSR